MKVEERQWIRCHDLHMHSRAKLFKIRPIRPIQVTYIMRVKPAMKITTLANFLRKIT